MASRADAKPKPTVRVSATTAMTVQELCGTEPNTSPGSFTLERDDSSGSLTVSYHIAGGPTDLDADPAAGADHTVSFADGEQTAVVTVHPAIDATDATVTIVSGSHY